MSAPLYVFRPLPSALPFSSALSGLARRRASAPAISASETALAVTTSTSPHLARRSMPRTRVDGTGQRCFLDPTEGGHGGYRSPPTYREDLTTSSSRPRSTGHVEKRLARREKQKNNKSWWKR